MDLIRTNPVTEIAGRRVDIKKAEPKAGGNNLPSGGGRFGGGAPPQSDAPATIPAYGTNRVDSRSRSRSSSYDRDRQFR